MTKSQIALLLLAKNKRNVTIIRSIFLSWGPHRLTVRTSAFQAGNRSSILRGVTFRNCLGRNYAKISNMNTKIIVHLPINENDRKVKIITTKPIVFLAGPIRNAPPWRNDAIKLLIEKGLDIFIASPARTISEELRPYVAKDKPEYELFERQRAWEQHYLYEAAKNGCIFFYLPKEAEVKEVADKVYSHITMMELGEWIERHKNNKEMNLVIATDGNFPEWSTIKYELEKEGVTNIFLSLSEGIDAVARLVSSTS